MKAHLEKIFARILDPDQRIGLAIEIIVKPGQQKPQRRSLRQNRQCRRFLGAERTLCVIGLKKRARFFRNEAVFAVEAPGIQRDRDVIGQRIRAGK